jgi:hypothetical protein
LVRKVNPSQFLCCLVCKAKPLDWATEWHLKWNIGFYIGVLGIKPVCKDSDIYYIIAVC